MPFVATGPIVDDGSGEVPVPIFVPKAESRTESKLNRVSLSRQEVEARRALAKFVFESDEEEDATEDGEDEE